jgi:hypothetical protein
MPFIGKLKSPTAVAGLETGSGGLGEGAITPALQMKPRSSQSTEASSRETLQYRIRLFYRTQIHVASIGKGTIYPRRASRKR